MTYEATMGEYCSQLSTGVLSLPWWEMVFCITSLHVRSIGTLANSAATVIIPAGMINSPGLTLWLVSPRRLS